MCYMVDAYCVHSVVRGNSIFKLKMSVQLEYFVIDVCSIRVDMCSNVTSSEFKTIAGLLM